MKLYPYQQEVKDTLIAGHSVVLQAPTGAGKTRAALAPFIETFFESSGVVFPRQAIYSIPMQVLASQFFVEYKNRAESYQRRLGGQLDVSIQTGEFPEDPKLEADLIFATLDQTLSSVLGVPYSLSRRSSNLNVGAVLGSYLVFDEFHLFPHQAATTTLQLLRSIRHVAPFVMMTATFTKTMLAEIEESLGAKLITLPEEEIAKIESGRGESLRKSRRYQTLPEVLAAKHVLKTHFRRSLALCNTVDRAVDLYKDLIDADCKPVPFDKWLTPDQYDRLRKAQNPNERFNILDQFVSHVKQHLVEDGVEQPWVMLLHSRFERPHRQVKERLIQSLWGKEAAGDPALPSLIVVSTQVVEVGLDISAEVLHTEIAPAANVFQRAGRCARFPGEQGAVYVYQVPENSKGLPNYAPYGFEEMGELKCRLAWQKFQEAHDSILHFAEEQEIIDFAHTAADRKMLDDMKQGESLIWKRIFDAVTLSDSSTRAELIRNNLESRTLLVLEPPPSHTLTEINPFHWDGFSLHRGTLHGKKETLKSLQEEMGLTWALRYPVAVKEEDEYRSATAFQWLDVDLDSRDSLSTSLIYAVHPRLVTYDAGQGFLLAQPGDGSYLSPGSILLGHERKNDGYRLESYQEHITRMIQVFEKRDGSRFQNRFAWLAQRLSTGEGNWFVPPGLPERALRLIFALHDLGKLNADWQKWAADYQRAIGENAPDFLIAHTHWEKDNPLHQKAQKQVKTKKPKTHAGESADAAAKILWNALQGSQNKGLYRAAFTAISRHHSPALDGQSVSAYRLHPQAADTLSHTLTAVGQPGWADWAQWLRDCPQGPPNVKDRLLSSEDSIVDWWLYFILVRYLRLCDGMSQEEV